MGRSKWIPPTERSRQKDCWSKYSRRRTCIRLISGFCRIREHLASMGLGCMNYSTGCGRIRKSSDKNFRTANTVRNPSGWKNPKGQRQDQKAGQIHRGRPSDSTGDLSGSKSPLRTAIFGLRYGFRPKRSAHDALRRCQANISDGYYFVVDMDLEKDFDTVNHRKFIQILSETIKDGRVISLIHRYLNAGGDGRRTV